MKGLSNGETMKTSEKTSEDVEQEDEDGTWPVSSFVLYPEYVSNRMICYGCWAEAIHSFEEFPCSKCQTQRPSHYSKERPTKYRMEKSNG